MNELPVGTVTFLFTDIEGSTNLLHQLGERYITLLTDHHRLLREVFAKWNGREVGTEGDSFFVSFPRASDAVAATIEAQSLLTNHNWPGRVNVRVRMGLHTGEPWAAHEGYVGMDVHRAARIANVGYGGQVLLSETTTALVIDQLPGGVSLLDLGRHRLKDIQRPERIRQLIIEGLPADFPPLKTVGVVGDAASTKLEPLELPAFLREDVVAPVQQVFVGRERELGWLEEHGREILEEQESGVIAVGRILLVIGEAGMGKSSLLQAFARKVTEANPDLLVTWGQGNAFSGQGDPYLPFREVFAQFCGDVEGPWRAGLLDSKAAGRLWTALPETAEILSRDGVDLQENLVYSKDLLRNLTAAAPKAITLHNHIQDLTDKDPYASSGGRSRLFEQVAAVLEGISANHPLLIILDDLHWVDRGSVDLLFQLGRQLSGKRILIVVAYRPEDVAAGREGGRHPLLPLVEEFKRIFGDITLDLTRAAGKPFVDDFVDSEPNKLDRTFRDRLLRRTGGHALFTVELLRDMQERGDLVQDGQGRWIEGRNLDWDVFPSKVEGVIESRIGRLEESLREILTVAAVEGESFTAQVVARVQQLQERQLLRSFSKELALRHRLVNERKAVEIGKQMLARYRFAHALFQRYLYNEISPVERRILHGEIATILEEIYGDERETIAGQLARHFLEAGDNEKAMTYLMEAGDQARQLNAHEESVEHYHKALTLAKDQNLYEPAGRILMKLGLTYSLALKFKQANASYQEAFLLHNQAATTAEVQRLPISTHPLKIMEKAPTHLDPLFVDDVYDASIVRRLFSGLVLIAPNGDVLPDVAERWDIRDGGKIYTFHLRRDVFWRDSRPVTAYDFEYAWRRSLNTVFRGDYLQVVRGAVAYHAGADSDWSKVGIWAEDEFTFVVELDKPAGYFLQMIAMDTLSPVPRHLVEENGDSWADPSYLVSNGPFFLEPWSQQDKEPMTLIRNPNYHGHAIGNVGQIFILNTRGIIPDEDTAGLEALYEANLVDSLTLTDTAPEIVKFLGRRFSNDYRFGPLLNTLYLALKPTRPPLNDVRVRRALTMAIDKQALARTVFGGLHDVASGGIVPRGMWGHSPGISLPFDPKRARELLDSSDIVPQLDFSQVRAYSSPEKRSETLYAVKSWQNELGLDIAYQTLSWNDLIRQIDSNLADIYTITWMADYQDPNNFMLEALRNILSNWNHPHYKALIDEAGQEMNQGRRLALYQQADKILIDEAVIIPLIHQRWQFLVKPWIRNWGLSSFNSRRLENIVIEPH